MRLKFLTSLASSPVNTGFPHYEVRLTEKKTPPLPLPLRVGEYLFFLCTAQKCIIIRYLHFYSQISRKLFYWQKNYFPFEGIFFLCLGKYIFITIAQKFQRHQISCIIMQKIGSHTDTTDLSDFGAHLQKLCLGY